ncbi:MAG: peptide-modifying radical SAM enzyme CbpB [Chloroflexi bacterium]|nr:peptide-modifying radical SAM enzyme CbpB [Chloroflexota bacterium]
MPSKLNIAAAPSRGRYLNTGNGPTLQPVDIGHDNYIGLVDPDTAFWSLVKRDKLGLALTNSGLLSRYRKKSAAFAEEMKALRFGLKPSAVYLNPTERCNLNCDYCYIPKEMRKNGKHMSGEDLFKALAVLKDYFAKTVPEGARPQIVFHGSEPMLNREAVFAAIERYRDDFRFGVQTNGLLLDETAIDFLTSRNIGIGLSLDGHIARVANKTRRNWSGQGSFSKVLAAMERLRGYHGYNVICTVTSKNLRWLTEIVDFFHAYGVPVCMLNPVRCTQPGARQVKPGDGVLARRYMAALDRTYHLYQQTGRKLVVANFANVLVSIIAPTARRLMCDISPCGGGRCFFALSANGDLFPCSEFIGLPQFNGGNIFSDDIGKVLTTRAFTAVTGRKVEDIEPCNRCAIRHFCGSPCPAEAFEMNGGMQRTGAFCELYEEQVRYALRLIADGKEGAFLWDDWDKGTTSTFRVSTLL